MRGRSKDKRRAGARVRKRAVDAGLVEVLGERAEPLPKAKARSEIERDATWEAKSSDAPDYYEVALTDAGVTALKALRSTFSHIGRVDRDN